jgi:hypothetical protein
MSGSVSLSSLSMTTSANSIHAVILVIDLNGDDVIGIDTDVFDKKISVFSAEGMPGTYHLVI